MAFKSIEQAVKELGAEQALKDLNKGFQNRMYRKERNMRREAMLEIVKNDAELLKQVQQRMAKQSK